MRFVQKYAATDGLRLADFSDLLRYAMEATMDDWLTAGIGAWLGNRWFGPWCRRTPHLSIGIFIVGAAASIAILLLLA